MKAKQLTITAILAIWGMLSFLVICGEESPLNPMSDAEFFAKKFIALASLGICIFTYRFCKAKDLLYKSDKF